MFEKLSPSKVSAENPEYCLSLDEILGYLDNCTNKMFDMLNPGQEFMACALMVALVTNLEYDPKAFSEEIEKSEEDRTIDELRGITEHPLFETAKKNSDEWKANHRKKGWMMTTFGPVLSAMERKEKMSWKRGNVEYELVEKIRTFGDEENKRRVTEWYNDLKSKGIHVYEVML